MLYQTEFIHTIITDLYEYFFFGFVGFVELKSFEIKPEGDNPQSMFQFNEV